MTSTQFRSTLESLGLSYGAAARLLGLTWRQIARYAGGDSRVPRSVEIVLRLLARGKIAVEDL